MDALYQLSYRGNFKYYITKNRIGELFFQKYPAAINVEILGGWHVEVFEGEVDEVVDYNDREQGDGDGEEFFARHALGELNTVW